jgi:tight adherence protein C
MTQAHAIELAMHACAAVGLFAAASWAAAVTPRARPTTGGRGAARRLALRSPLFAPVEPPMRWLAAALAPALPSTLRERAQIQLEHGGGLAGLDGDELLALCVLAGSLAALLALGLGASPGLALAAVGIVTAMPVLQVREKARRYQHRIARELPGAIDVMALAMGAGLGFAAALELATREAIDPGSPLGRELTRVRQAILTGRSRRDALEGLARFVPCEAVRDFASAVVQGELKGTPLAGILEVQARTLRGRRAVMAEEAAARASVLLVLPLLLLLATVLLLMVGPFLVHGMGLR